MKISQQGIDLIKEFEGCSLKAYKCPAGVWTIGYGHTKDVTPYQTITKQQAENLLKYDLVVYEDYVNRLKLPLNQNQFDALVSFTYNCGGGNLVKLVSKRNLTQIGEALLLYNKANGKVLKGLQRRRQAEKDLYFKPVNEKSSYKVKITATALNVRAGVGVSHKIVRVLKKNAVVDVLSTCNGWGQISTGWINLKYTKKV